ncbi:hypothetical protein MKX42_22470 [Paenibacillus sp. FSL R7-0204]|uniref:hypothetical protein n=1 Tax=Paenibacillus sp. FSL R7-0204 TaxID=2921675 RepID=UPI0030F9D1DC
MPPAAAAPAAVRRSPAPAGPQKLPQPLLYGRVRSEQPEASLAAVSFTPLSSWDFVFDGILFFM